MDPQTWVGLPTFVVFEIVLDIDNLVFIAVLADELLPKQRGKARLVDLSLALIMRLGSLSVVSWVMTLTKPLFMVMNYAFPGRDLIMLLGGIPLLFEATTELHEQLENHGHDTGRIKGYASFWVAVTQIVILDAAFPLDVVITMIGMVNHLLVMMTTIVIAMAVMLLASKPLTRLVNQHPMVAVLCLSFLLMIGLSLVAEEFGFHILKGHLYAAIDFSIIIELFNQIAYRNFIRHQSTLPLRARIADTVLCLMGGKRQVNVQMKSDSLMPVPVLEGAFVEEEHYVVNGILSLASRSLRGITTPCGEISWADTNLSVAGTREQLFSSPHSLFPVCRSELDEIIGIVHAKEPLTALEDGVGVAAATSASPATVVPETLDSTNLLDVLRRARDSPVIVTSEFDVVQGLVMPLDVLKTIIGEFPGADGTPEIITDAGGWLIKSGTDLYALQQALNMDTLVNEDEDIVTVVGLVIAASGHIPCIDDVTEIAPLGMAIAEANDYRVGLVHIAKEQPAHDEDK